MAKSTKDQSKTSGPKTSADSITITSLQGSVDGRWQLDLLAGLTIDLSGPEALPASPSQPPEPSGEPTTIVTSGQSSSGLYASANLQHSLVNKLQQRLPTAGPIPFSQDWKVKATPQGRLYSQLVVSALPKSGTGSTSSPTCWPTVSTQDNIQVCGQAQASSRRKAGTTLGGAVRMVAYPWPTPAAMDNRQRGTWTDPVIQRRVSIGKSVELSMLVGSIANPPIAKMTDTDLRPRLNPGFCLWLMGYPVIWLIAGIRTLSRF